MVGILSSFMFRKRYLDFCLGSSQLPIVDGKVVGGSCRPADTAKESSFLIFLALMDVAKEGRIAEYQCDAVKNERD
jgi:hypothetical protein